MAAVARLVTLADLEDAGGDARHMSVSLRHEAVLTDGRRLPLLDDRGWSMSLNHYGADDGTPKAIGVDTPDVWAMTSTEDIEQTARVTVGPDEPSGGGSHADMEAGHWAWLTAVLRRQGVTVEARELQRLPHDVVLSERLRARSERTPGS